MFLNRHRPEDKTIYIKKFPKKRTTQTGTKTWVCETYTNVHNHNSKFTSCVVKEISK